MKNLKPKPRKIQPEKISHRQLNNVPMETLKEPTAQPSTIEQILKNAPKLPWKYTARYIEEQFRPKYRKFLQGLIAYLNLPYTVNDLGELTRKE